MQSLINLQNTLTELQWMVTNTIDPVFTDLQNGSHVFDPVIASHTSMIEKINEMITFLNSGVIVGLQGVKGDTGSQGIQGLDGIQGIQGIQGLSYNDTIVIKTNPTIFNTSSAILVELSSMTTPLLADSIYEIKAYIEFSSPSTTTGLYVGLNTPLNSIDFVDISVPVTNVQSSGTLRFLSPNGNLPNNTPSVKGTAVNVANQKLTSIITGHIQTGATAGSLKIMVGSEVSGSTISIGTNTKLFLNKIA